jgi:hypothetical protein
MLIVYFNSEFNIICSSCSVVIIIKPKAEYSVCVTIQLLLYVVQKIASAKVAYIF